MASRLLRRPSCSRYRGERWNCPGRWASPIGLRTIRLRAVVDL
ncbi:hypothetical protein L838_4026 [Mycobacterium avium MAV_120709_2344]|nr:hypothetical protein L838_4026 [Mycobacterium avium MAV_120709_2344]